jgi:tetratricopeptide (TPR) repeat protein
MRNKGRLQFALLLMVVLTVLITSASAQQTMQPDRKAYTDANAIKEPDKKIAALEKFAVDFPESSSLYMAHQMIFNTLVKSFPDQTAKILEQAGKTVDKAPDLAKSSLYSTLGSALCDAGILLDDAEKFTSKGLALAEEEMAKSARQRRATYLATLGRVYLKQGKLNEAEKNLKQAVADNPQLMPASIGLAELFDKRGDGKMAVNAYINAAVSGKLPAASRQQLDALYAKTYNGSMAGLENMLDAKYMERYPPPFSVAHYKPSAKRSDRVVLTEVFTGSGCPPCVAADLAADLAMDRYSRTELAVLMYHEHIPQPDPMTTPQTTARFRYYAGTGVPTVVIDGHGTVGGGGREATKTVYDGFNKEIEGRLEAAPEAAVKLTALMDGTMVRTNAVVSKVTAEVADLKLHIVLAEGKLRYTGENGVRFHPMVVRSMAATDAGQGLAITSKDSQTFAWDFNLTKISADIKQHLDEYEKAGHRGASFTFTEKKYQIDSKDLVVVAFVQNEKTKAILQSIFINVKP